MPDAYVVEGGHRLTGGVCVAGAKNSALYLLAAALLAPGASVLRRVPRIVDVHTMLAVLGHLGAGSASTSDGTLTVDVPADLATDPPADLVSRMRASISVLGPLVARRGHACLALPGGCDLGARGIDLHLAGLERLGAEVSLERGVLVARALRLRGTRIDLEYPSHGATANLLTAAVLAEGTTLIRNASREPEVVDLARLLEAMGARIGGAGTHELVVDGVDALHPVAFDVMPDRLEAATYLFATAGAGGDVVVYDVRPDELTLVLEKLTDWGANVETAGSDIRISASGQPVAADVSTLPYPGFPTDLQPLAVALLTRAHGTSIVTENVFESRYVFVEELRRMGADIHVDGHYAAVRGVPALHGSKVRATDLRAGAAVVVAALCARGRTVVEDVHHVDRGYEDLAGRLAGLGARVQRVAALELAAS